MPCNTTRARSTRHNACERSHPVACNTQKSIAEELRPPAAPAAPVIAGTLVTREQQTFLEFLFDSDCDSFCKLMFAGENTCVGMMIKEFRKATQFHYFGHRQATPGRKHKPRNPGLLSEENSATKKLLIDFVRKAYRGDPDRRGIAFWHRIAWILWNSYSALMMLRRRAAKAKDQELERLVRRPEKRKKRAGYMRNYRAKRSKTTDGSQIDAGP